MNITDIVLNPTVKNEPGLCCSQPSTALPKNMPPAMLYVSYQSWQKVYDPVVGIDRGTIFEELDKPFIGERA